MGCNNIVPQAGNAGKIGLVRPCGVCIACRLNYSRSKAVRAVHELDSWDCSSFVTLTYDPDFLIYSPGAIAPTVSRRDLQLFFKLLRRKIEPLKISYMASAEYGESTQRPHYHAIIYGFDFSFDREYWKKSPEGNDLYTSQLLSDAWGNKGHAVVGDVTFESAAYVASYTVKKLSGKKATEEYDDLGRLPPFGAMSARPAIGRRWIEKWLYDVYPRDYVISRGHKTQPPRYYDDYLKSVNPDLYKRVMRARLDRGRERAEKDVVSSGVVRSICQDAKISQKTSKF